MTLRRRIQRAWARLFWSPPWDPLGAALDALILALAALVFSGLIIILTFF